MKIISEFTFPSGIKALTLDEDIPNVVFNSYRIGEKLYEANMVYDIKKTIAVKTSDRLLGKTVEFVMVQNGKR